MKNLTFYLLALSILSSITCYGNDNRIDLNGMWRFKAPINIEYGAYGTIPQPFDVSDWDSINVPANWDTLDDYNQYLGEVAYSRNFFIGEELRNEELFIHFDAVYHDVKVYVNGNYLGKHNGGYTPFDFCITDFIKYGEENHILVLADNTYSRGAWWSWGGISRNVYIKRHNTARIKKFHISAIPDFEHKTTTITIDGIIENLKTDRTNLTIEIDFDNPNIESIRKGVTLECVQNKSFGSKFEIPNNSIKLWHFDDPQLYTATLNVKDGVKIITSQKTRFGVRKVEIKGTKFYLNNEPIRAFGFNRIADHKAFGNTEPIDLIKKDIDDMKSLGCVITRMMHAPLSPELLDYCDEKGMLIIQEIPVWSKFDPNSFNNNPVSKQWMKEMIERDFNHPCVIGWSVANEIGIDVHWTDMKMSKEQYKYVASMFEYIKSELDTTRLLTYASFTAFRAKANKGIEPAGLGDFICINAYGDMLANCKDVHSKWPDKPIFITEFGRGQIGENLNTSDLAPVVVELMNEVQKLPYVIGASLWSYNDYRSRYTGTPFSGNRLWGVVDVWRNKKLAANTIHKMFSPIKKFKANLIKNKLDISFEYRTESEIPFYTLNDYYIMIENTKGNSKNILLTSNASNSHQQSITLDKNLLSGNHITVRLMTPTGIAIEESKISLSKLKEPTLIYAAHDDNKMQVEFKAGSEVSNYQLLYNDTVINLINPKFEIPLNLSAKDHNISLQISDDNNNSYTSKQFKLTNKRDILPPMIMAVVQNPNGFTIGYTSDEGDLWYEIEYTANGKTKTIKTKLVSSCLIREQSISKIRIRKTSDKGISNWSLPHIL